MERDTTHTQFSCSKTFNSDFGHESFLDSSFACLALADVVVVFCLFAIVISSLTDQ